MRQHDASSCQAALPPSAGGSEGCSISDEVTSWEERRVGISLKEVISWSVELMVARHPYV
jgi:hypothetical protein